MIEKVGFPVVQVAWNQLAVNGMDVEIILACTAIEHRPVLRYNLLCYRCDYGSKTPGFCYLRTYCLFSEHFITKAGSLMALILISYIVLKMLPEVADMIDGIFKMMRKEFHRLTLRFSFS